MIRYFTLAAACLCAAAPASADIAVRFIEGAPKDRFVVAAAGDLCADGPVRVTVDLAGSAGALIFDVTGAGAGVEVFQPFELVSGAALVTGATAVKDGDTALTLELSDLGPAEEVAFTIDVDDTIGAREITVNGAEITGARVAVEADGTRAEAAFDQTARATVPWTRCG